MPLCKISGFPGCKGVNFVEKENNPPNIPQLRVVERFWSHLKSKVYVGGWKARDFGYLKRRINSELKKFDVSYFERLFSRSALKI